MPRTKKAEKTFSVEEKKQIKKAVVKLVKLVSENPIKKTLSQIKKERINQK